MCGVLSVCVCVCARERERVSVCDCVSASPSGEHLSYCTPHSTHPLSRAASCCLCCSWLHALPNNHVHTAILQITRSAEALPVAAPSKLFSAGYVSSKGFTMVESCCHRTRALPSPFFVRFFISRQRAFTTFSGPDVVKVASHLDIKAARELFARMAEIESSYPFEPGAGDDMFEPTVNFFNGLFEFKSQSRFEVKAACIQIQKVLRGQSPDSLVTGYCRLETQQRLTPHNECGRSNFIRPESFRTSLIVTPIH